MKYRLLKTEPAWRYMRCARGDPTGVSTGVPPPDTHSKQLRSLYTIRPPNGQGYVIKWEHEATGKDKPLTKLNRGITSERNDLRKASLRERRIDARGRSPGIGRYMWRSRGSDTDSEASMRTCASSGDPPQNAGNGYRFHSKPHEGGLAL